MAEFKKCKSCNKLFKNDTKFCSEKCKVQFTLTNNNIPSNICEFCGYNYIPNLSNQYCDRCFPITKNFSKPKDDIDLESTPTENVNKQKPTIEKKSTIEEKSTTEKKSTAKKKSYVCANCGDIFSSKKYSLYCKDCANILLGSYKPNLEHKNQMCKQCNQPFVPDISPYYCNKCYFEKYNKIHIDDKSLTRICKYCGNEFVSNKREKFCNKDCSNKYFTSEKSIREFNKSNMNNTVVQDTIKRTESIRANLDNKTINQWLISGFTNKLKELILERDGYKCYICGKETDLHIHHIIPRIDGGPHIPENLITLCSGCHRSIEAGDVENAIIKCVKRAVDNIHK